MNKSLIFALIFILSITTAKTQSTDAIDDLRISQFDICFTGKPAAKKNAILLDKDRFLQKFGKPIKNTREFSEVADDTVTHIRYAGAEAWFQDNYLLAINIRTPSYSLKINDGSVLKVGDPVAMLIKRFPLSWGNKQSKDQVFVSLKDGNIYLDMNLIFDIDVKTNKIKEITLQ